MCAPEETVFRSPVTCCVTGRVCSKTSHRNWPTVWITTATYHTWEVRDTRPPEMNFDWPGGFNMEVMLVFAEFFGRICFAFATSSRWYCPVVSDVMAECPRTHAWVSRSVSGLWNHISAWNVIFLVAAVHFDTSRRAVVVSPWNFYM